jgi:DNA-binding NarL/FixJ family response regulator
VAQRAFDFYVEGKTAYIADPNLVLSPREREVLPLIAEGQSSRQIASFLNVSPRTVEFHRANIMHKLGLKSEKELIRFCLQAGITSARR